MNKKQIILIDDSPIVRELTKVSLESHLNCDVHTFEYLPEKQKELLRKADLVIIDYCLGVGQDKNELNGKDVVKIFNKRFPNVPIIMFSGQHDIKVAKELIAFGLVDYIDKNDDDFLDRLVLGVNKALEIKDLKQTIVEGKKEIKTQINQLLTLFILTVLALFTLLIF